MYLYASWINLTLVMLLAVSVTRVSSKGQVVIPKNLKEKLGIKEGDRLLVYAVRDLIVLRKFKAAESILSIVSAPFMKKAAERGITRKDVDEAIADVRKRRAAEAENSNRH